MRNRKEKRQCQRSNNLNKHIKSTRFGNSSFQKIAIAFLLACCLVLSLSAFGVNAESAIAGYESAVVEYENPQHQRCYKFDLRSIVVEVWDDFGDYDTGVIQIDPPIFDGIDSEWSITQTITDTNGSGAYGTAYVDWNDWGTYQEGTYGQWHAMEMNLGYSGNSGIVNRESPSWQAFYFGDSYIDQYSFMNLRWITERDLGYTANTFTLTYRLYWVDNGVLQSNNYYEQVGVETEPGDYEATISLVTENMAEKITAFGGVLVTDLVVYGNCQSTTLMIEGTEKQQGYQNASDFFAVNNITTDPTKSEIPPMFGWLGRSLTAFLDIPLYDGVTLGGILGIFVAISAVLIFLKYFAGG